MNKKIKFACIVSLFLCCKIYAQQVDFILESDSFLFESGLVYASIDFAKQGRKIPSGTNLIFDIKNKYAILPFGGGINTIQVKLEDGSEGFVNVEDLKQTDEDILISQKLKKDKNGYWIDSYNYDIIRSASCDVLDKHEPYWKNDFAPIMAEDSLSNSIKNNMHYLASDYFYVYCYDNSRQGFFIFRSLFENEYIKLSLYSHNNSDSTEGLLLSKIRPNRQYDLYLKCDGDYLLVYLDEIKTSPDATLVFVSKEQDNIIVDLKREIFTNEKLSDLSKVNWPRHADGTCDYDANSNETASSNGISDMSAKEAAIPKPAPAMGKTAVVTENLRLRTDDKTMAKVVTTLAAGARVKVFAPGREDTIDGIASSWVQVSVLDGAKDKDGNAIEASTIGWLFGGYLSEAESAESERANEEASNTKKSSALPIVPIVVGVAALAILLTVVILATKRKKVYKD